MAKQVANFFNNELIRCVKTDENGDTVVKYLSPYVVKSEFLFERTGFKPDDPNLDEKLGIQSKEVETLQQITETNPMAESNSTNGTVKQTAAASSLIERFGDPGRKRKRTNIKIHHAD